MDADEIRTLLGDNIFERAKKYRKRIQQSTCTVNEDGVRHISAMVQGSGGSYYYTQAWLRENGSFVSASCSCPYNQNGEGTYCKHIGALLLDDAEKNAPAPAAKPDACPNTGMDIPPSVLPRICMVGWLSMRVSPQVPSPLPTLPRRGHEVSHHQCLHLRRGRLFPGRSLR